MYLCNVSVGTLPQTKTILHMNRRRKTTPKTSYKMESTGPKVLSRYLRGPTGSCHDHCKCAPEQTTETKPTNPFLKRIPKPPAADRTPTYTDAPDSVPKLKKAPSVIPKITTPRNLKSNNAVKDQILKKDDVIEPKKRDLKPKTENGQAKTYNTQSSRTPRRRHSDIFIPNKDMSLPFSRFPKRRLSEIIVHPNTNGSRINKNETSKELKLPSPNKKPNSSKTNIKTPPLRSYKSLPKLELKGSRKSKPTKAIEEFVPEKTLHVIETTNGVESTESQNNSSSSEVKVMTDDQNGVLLQVSSLSTEDDTVTKDGQQNDNVSVSEANDTEEKTRVGKLEVETVNCSEGDLRFRRGTIISPESENNSPRKLEFKKGKELDEEETEKGETKSLRRLSSDGVVCSFQSQMISVDLKHQEMEEKEVYSGLFNNVIEETANKLIQTRKSKVKALVGAFENIVSASNQRPQPQTLHRNS